MTTERLQGGECHARRPRLRIAGIPQHLIQRGNNRSACFFSQQDYRYYLEHLEDVAKQQGVALHAYVLMTNHVHLLVTPHAEESVSNLMKHLGSGTRNTSIALTAVAALCGRGGLDPAS